MSNLRPFVFVNNRRSLRRNSEGSPLIDDVKENVFFLFSKEKERTKEKPFWRKTAFFGKGGTLRFVMQYGVPPFVKAVPSIGCKDGFSQGHLQIGGYLER